MGEYPSAARDAAVTCIPCNAPAVRTVAGTYVCVSCGDEPVLERSGRAGPEPVRPAGG